MSGDPVSFTPPGFQINYGSSWELAYQQTDSRLRDAVSTRTGVTGRVWQDNIIDDFEMEDDNVRGGDTVLSDITADIWNVLPTPAYHAAELPRWDKEYLHNLALPDSEIVQSQAAAVARKIDNRIIAAMTGTAYRGNNATTAVTLPSAQQIASTYMGPESPAAGPLNWYKISRAKALLDLAEVPFGDRYLAFDAENLEALANDVIQNHSGELTSIKGMNSQMGQQFLLENGLFNFKFIQTQRVLRDESDVVTVVAWHKKAVKNGIWGDRRSFLDRMPGRKQAMQIYTDVNTGATRARDTGVVSIACDLS
jgi:hypothetical protein